METFERKKFSKLSNEEAIQAVESGIKPIAFLKQRANTNLPCLEFESLMLSADSNNKITRIFKEKNYVYYQVGQEDNADRIKELVIQMNDAQAKNLKIGDLWIPNPPSKEYHKEMGELLGYTQDETNDFNNSLKTP